MCARKGIHHNYYLDYHTSIHTVAMACPGVDYIRLWPVTQPWQDPTDWPEGWYVWRTPPDVAGFSFRDH